jgi:thiol:disulfide interchange protein
MTHSINPRKGFRIHLLVFLLTIPAIWIIWLLTEQTYPWPLWQTLGWTIGIWFHYLGAFVFKKSTNI